MKRKDKILSIAELEIAGHYPFDENEFEIAGDMIFFKRIIPALKFYLARSRKILNHLPEIQVYLGINLEPNMKIYSYKNIRYDLGDLIIELIGIVYPVDMNEPVFVGPFRLFLED